MNSLLISTADLAQRLQDPTLVIADVRWEANPPEAAFNSYQQGHIPGAIFFDLDEDLADRSDLGKGRHPLPDPQSFVQMLAQRGIGSDKQVVVYDDKLGSLAARLWWMMQWIGGPEAMILDGGFAKWMTEERPIETGVGRRPTPTSRPLAANPNSALIAELREVEAATGSGLLLLDARAPERFRGEIEPLDARAGHIPGARNAPWSENLSSAQPQIFKRPEELRSFYKALGVTTGAKVVCSCGSGVTACHNLFALELAGFSGARLYPGSWSEWVAQHP